MNGSREATGGVLPPFSHPRCSGSPPRGPRLGIVSLSVLAKESITIQRAFGAEGLQKSSHPSLANIDAKTPQPPSRKSIRHCEAPLKYSDCHTRFFRVCVSCVFFHSFACLFVVSSFSEMLNCIPSNVTHEFLRALCPLFAGIGTVRCCGALVSRVQSGTANYVFRFRSILLGFLPAPTSHESSPTSPQSPPSFLRCISSPAHER